MRVIAKTQSTPHIPISVGPSISSDCAAEISSLLQNMNTSDEGRAVLAHNNFSGFTQGKNSEERPGASRCMSCRWA